ncbi:MAG: hypothetical protein IKP26_08700 [Clostridia bacterium]|nr:hypothetical protein [Clostridia bacterium]MBR4659317.1 hypothetical protein [Clostridia bacterium]
MKRIISLMVAAVLTLLSPISSFALDAEVPEEVSSFAELTAMPYVKNFMKNPENRAIGSIVGSAEDVDELTLGSGMRVYQIDGSDAAKLSDQLTPLDDWCFSLDAQGRKTALFEVHRSETGRLSHSGVQNGENLENALEIMERLAKSAGVAFEPKLCRFTENFVLLQSFGGDERVITIPTDVQELDRSYSEAAEYRELPTGEELVSAINEQMNNAQPDSYGGAELLLAAHPGVLTGDAPAAIPQPDNAVSPLVFIIPAAAVVIAALIAAIVVKKKKAIR